MAITDPRSDSPTTRADRRRQRTVDEALEHAVAIMAEQGVGALSVSEVARRLGMRPPSLYKYFPSLHALYDALFARGLALHADALAAAVENVDPGVPWLRAGAIATVRWAVEHQAIAALLFWRPVPGFQPSPASFAPSVQVMANVRDHFRQAVRRKELAWAADSDDAVRLFTILQAGIISQQLANAPNVPFSDGEFTRLTTQALDCFFAHYRPKRRT